MSDFEKAGFRIDSQGIAHAAQGGLRDSFYNHPDAMANHPRYLPDHWTVLTVPRSTEIDTNIPEDVVEGRYSIHEHPEVKGNPLLKSLGPVPSVLRRPTEHDLPVDLLLGRFSIYNHPEIIADRLSNPSDNQMSIDHIAADYRRILITGISALLEYMMKKGAHLRLRAEEREKVEKDAQKFARLAAEYGSEAQENIFPD